MNATRVPLVSGTGIPVCSIHGIATVEKAAVEKIFFFVHRSVHPNEYVDIVPERKHERHDAKE